MARNNLPKCLPITLAHEGGMSLTRADPGNWTGGKVGVGVLKGTKYGVAASAYPHLDIKNLTLADVEPIYRRNYWDKVRGDDLPAGVDLTVFDYGVNSGPSRSAKELQRVVKTGVDGKIGDGTLRAVAASNGKTVIQGVCARRMSFLRALPIWNTFKNGWTRRVADIEAKSVAMWLSSQGVAGKAKTDVLKAEEKTASDTASKQNQGAAATTGGGGVGTATGAASADPNWLLIGGIAAAVVIVAVILILKSRQNKERAAAYRAAADDVPVTRIDAGLI